MLLAAAGAAVTAPAHAKFDLGSLIGGAIDVVGAFASGEEDEITMGENFYEDYLEKSGGIYPDRNAQEALRKFAEPILAAADRKNLPWEVTLVDNEEVNAWALPGGKIAIHSELVCHCETPDELASVIAHEVGHADRGHSLSQIQNQALISSLGGLGIEALSSWVGGRGSLGAEVLSALEEPLYAMILTGYSRAHEFEADAHILKIFEQTGHDPDKADDFFRTLLRLSPEGSTTSLFSTHPGTTERIAKIEEAAATLSSRSSRTKHPGWSQLKSMFPSPEA
jgi:predicted Zn-dependent protease